MLTNSPQATVANCNSFRYRRMVSNRKLKTKLSLCFLPEHHAMEACWGSEGIAPRILDLGTRCSEWSASRPGRFIHRERAPGTHCIGGWWWAPEPVWTRWWGQKLLAAIDTRTPDHPARSPR